MVDGLNGKLSVGNVNGTGIPASGSGSNNPGSNKPEAPKMSTLETDEVSYLNMNAGTVEQLLGIKTELTDKEIKDIATNSDADKNGKLNTEELKDFETQLEE